MLRRGHAAGHRPTRADRRPAPSIRVGLSVGDVTFDDGDVFGAPVVEALEWARMLLTREEPGDADRARGLLGQALGTARELGLATVERRAVELMS